jgi:hypothetical protein
MSWGEKSGRGNAGIGGDEVRSALDKDRIKSENKDKKLFQKKLRILGKIV